MTEEQKEAADATRFLIVQFPNGGGEASFIVVETADSDGTARKRSEELAMSKPGVSFGVFQKRGSWRAELKAEWKGVPG